jgi:hypothetical protein
VGVRNPSSSDFPTETGDKDHADRNIRRFVRFEDESGFHCVRGSDRTLMPILVAPQMAVYFDFQPGK